MSVLITAANSAQAYRLKGILHIDEPVLLGDFRPIPDLMLKNGTILKTPDPQSPSFAHQMLSLCLDKGINMLFPLRKEELLPLAEARVLFIEFDVQIILPATQQMEGHFTPVEGSLVVLNRSEVIGGDMDAAIAHQLTDGAFLIGKTGEYQIFTAD